MKPFLHFGAGRARPIASCFLATTALAAGATTLTYGCSAAPLEGERLGAQSEAVLGPTSYSSCKAADVPNLELAYAYGRVATNSPAFKECIDTAFSQNLKVTPPGFGPVTIGPYVACSSDPPTPSAATILTSLMTANPTDITCDYSQIGTSKGGYAGLGGVPSDNPVTPENITLGSELGWLQNASLPCFSAAPGAACVADQGYAELGDTILHEVMHQHGYNHFEYGNPPFLCGIPQSENPSYANSVNYQVGECIRAVIEESIDHCTMHQGCSTAHGLMLQDSILSASSSCSCVTDPKPNGPLLTPATWHTAAPLPADPNGPQFPAGGGIAAFSRVPGNMDIFTIGFDGKLWSAGAWNNGWQKPFAVPGQTAGFVPGGGLAAVARVSNQLETYAIGYDGRLWNTGSYRDGSGWASPFAPNPTDSARFQPGGGIAAVSRNSSILDTFAIGYDGFLWESGAWDDTKGAWQSAFRVPGSASFQTGGGVAAAATDANHVYVFAIGNDGQLWVAGSWNGSQWSTSSATHPGGAVQFPAGSPLAATVRDAAVLDVWVIGYDGQLWNAGSCNVSTGACDGNWGAPYKPAPESSATFKVGGGIAATSRTTNHLDIEAIGNDQRTWEVGWWGYGQ
ncbi:MAG TPA: hypothetical protein VGI39_24890 [Polyangiaceae bacterium]|jgi:hypothetical protein